MLGSTLKFHIFKTLTLRPPGAGSVFQWLNPSRGVEVGQGEAGWGRAEFQADNDWSALTVDRIRSRYSVYFSSLSKISALQKSPGDRGRIVQLITERGQCWFANPCRCGPWPSSPERVWARRWLPLPLPQRSWACQWLPRPKQLGHFMTPLLKDSSSSILLFWSVFVLYPVGPTCKPANLLGV